MVSSRSCFCSLYRALQSSAAKNIVNHLTLIISLKALSPNTATLEVMTSIYVLKRDTVHSITPSPLALNKCLYLVGLILQPVQILSYLLICLQSLSLSFLEPSICRTHRFSLFFLYLLKSHMLEFQINHSSSQIIPLSQGYGDICCSNQQSIIFSNQCANPCRIQQQVVMSITPTM